VSARHQGHSLTKSGVAIGTRGYMAPEQVAGEKGVGPSVDLFSLGCVLYECLTGRGAFQAESTEELFRRLLFEDVRPIAELNPSVPRPLIDLVAALLAKEAAARPVSAGVVVNALEAIACALAATRGWRLVVIEGPDAGREIEATTFPVDIGKHARASLRLADRAASKFHAEVAFEADAAIVRDLGSMNGTYVGAKRVQNARVAPGEEIAVGRSRIRIEPCGVLVPSPDPLTLATRASANVLLAAGTPRPLDLAVAIHEGGGRRRGRFVRVEGRALDVGSLVSADGGTLFLTDADAIPRETQNRIQPCLERRTADVGGAPVTLDVRVITSASSDLRLAVNEDRFGSRLYEHLAELRFGAG
jgi:hypothetical protein